MKNGRNIQRDMEQSIIATTRQRTGKVRLRRAIALLSAVVVFFTMNSLKFEADTLEHYAMCGLEEHIHDSGCLDETGQLICGMEEHAHTDACFQERPVRPEPTVLDEFIDLNSQVNLSTPMVAKESAPEDAVEEVEFELGAEDAVENAVAMDPAMAIVYDETAYEIADAPIEYEMNTDVAFLSDVLNAVSLEVANVTAVGEIVDDGIVSEGNNIVVEPLEGVDGEFVIRAVADFERAELGIIGDDIVSVWLLNGKAAIPAEEAEGTDEDQTEVGSAEEDEEASVSENDAEIAATEKAEETSEDQETEKTEETVENRETEASEETVENKETEASEETVKDRESEESEETVEDKESEESEETVENKETKESDEAVNDEEAAEDAGEKGENTADEAAPALEAKTEEAEADDEDKPQEEAAASEADEAEGEEASEANSEDAGDEAVEEMSENQETPEAAVADAEGDLENLDQAEAAAADVYLDFTDYIATGDNTTYLYDAERGAVLARVNELASVEGVTMEVVEPEDAEVESDPLEAEMAGPEEAVSTEAPAVDETAVQTGDGMTLDNGTLIITDNGALTLGEVTYEVSGLTLPTNYVEGDNIAISTVDGAATLLNVTPSIEETRDDYDEIYSMFTEIMDEEFVIQSVDETIQSDAMVAAYAAADAEQDVAAESVQAEAVEAVMPEADNVVETHTLSMSLFNISLQDAAGEVEPDSPVHVETSFEPIEGSEFKLFHIVEGEAVEVDGSVILDEAGRAIGLSFDTDTLSPFAVVYYTVDFHYEGVDYSIPGESQILLSELIDILNITNESGAKIDVADVVGVSFSDERLVTVEQVSGLISYNEAENVDVGEKDFLLTSLEPFSSKETLTLTLTDGREIIVGVTDDNVPNLADIMDSAMNNSANFLISTTDSLNNVERDGKLSFHLRYYINEASQLNSLRETSATLNGREVYGWYLDLNVDDVGKLVNNANGYTGNLMDSTGKNQVGEFRFDEDKIYFYLYKTATSGTNEKVELSPSSADLTVNLDFNVQMDSEKVTDKHEVDLNFPGTVKPHVTFKPYSYNQTTKTYILPGTVNQNGNETQVTDADFVDGKLTVPWTVSMTQPVDMTTLTLTDTMNNGLKLDPTGNVTISWTKPDGSTGSKTIANSTLNETGFTIDMIAQTGMNPIPANTQLTVTYDSIITKEDVINGQQWRKNSAEWTINGNPGIKSEPSVSITYKDTTIKNGTKGVEAVGHNPFVEADKDGDGNYRLKYTLKIKEPVDVTNLSLTDTPDSRLTIDYDSFNLSYYKDWTLETVSANATNNQDGTFTVDLDSFYADKVSGKIPADTELTLTYEAIVPPELVQEEKEFINTANYTVESTKLDDLVAKLKVKVDPEEGDKFMTRANTQVSDADIDQNGKFEIPYEASVTLKHPYDELEFIDTLNSYHELKDGSVYVSINGTEYEASSYVTKSGSTFTVDIDAVWTGSGKALPVPTGTELKVKYSTLAVADSVVDKGVKVENDSSWKFDNHPRDGENTSDDFTGPQDEYTRKEYTREVNDDDEVVYTFQVTIGDGSYPLDGHTVSDVAEKKLLFDSTSGFTVECTSTKYATDEAKNASAAAVQALIIRKYVDPDQSYYMQNQNADTSTVFELTFPKEGDANYNGPYYGPYVITYKMESANALLNTNNQKEYRVKNTVTHQKVTKEVNFNDRLPTNDPSIDKEFEKWDLDNGSLTYWLVEVDPPQKGTNYKFALTEDGNFTKWGKTEGTYDTNTTIYLQNATAFYKSNPNRSFTDFRYDNSKLIFEAGVLTEPIYVRIPVKLEYLTQGHDIYVRNKVQLQKLDQWNNTELIQEDDAYAEKKNFYPQPTISKTVTEHDDATGNTTWMIEINKDQKAFPAGTYVTLTDIIPDGMTWGTGYGDQNEFKLNVYTQSNDSNNYNGNSNPTTDNVDSSKGGGTFTLELQSFQKADGTTMPLDLNGRQIIIRYKTKMVDGEYENLINVGEKPYTNTASITDGGQFSGSDDATQIYGYDAVDKTEQVGEGLSGGVETLAADVIDYEVVVNKDAKTLNDGKVLTLTDVIPTNVELNVGTIRVYNAAGTDVTRTEQGIEVSYVDDSRTLMLRLPDSKKFTVKFSVNATSTGNQAQTFTNTVSLQGKGYWEDTHTSEHIVKNHQGSAVASVARITLYKIDGNNVIQKLDGAKFDFYKCTLDEDGRIKGKTLVNNNVTTGSDTAGDGMVHWYLPGADDLSNSVFYFVETTPSASQYSLGEYAEPHYFIMYDGERGGASYLAADALDKKVEEANGITINKVNKGYTWTITNRSKMDYTVTKQWSGDEDDPSTRPDYIWVRLLQDGELYTGTDVTNPVKITPRVDGKWTYTWQDLPLMNTTSNKAYTYTAVEDREKKPDNDYTTEVLEKLANYACTVDGNTITNRLIKHDEIEVIKKWSDFNNIDYTRPASITVKLYRVTNGSEATKELVETVELRASKTASENWRKLFTDLPAQGTGGETYTYIVEEAEVEGYVPVPGGRIVVNPATDTGTVEITNVLSTGVSVDKTWVHADGTGNWPENVTVTMTLSRSDNQPVLDKDDQALTTEQLSHTLDSTNISYTWENLGELPAGVTYRVEETDVKKNNVSVFSEGVTTLDSDAVYDSTSEDEGTTTHITNTQRMRSVSIEAEKTWTDVPQDNVANAVRFTLYRQVDPLSLEAADAEEFNGNKYVPVTSGIRNTPINPDAVATPAGADLLIGNPEGTADEIQHTLDNWKTGWKDLESGETYYVRETGVSFDGGVTFVDPDMYTVTGENEVAITDGSGRIVINNQFKTVDVPVTKEWNDFSGDEYNWSVEFVLQQAKDTDAAGPSDNDFVNVAPERKITITKEMMSHVGPGETPEQLAARSFAGLPKYGKDANGVYRIQYSLDELSYKVWQGTNEANPIYTWSKSEGWKNGDGTETDEDHRYAVGYPHDAGELSKEDSDYYIETTNAVRVVEIQRKINVTLDKEWQDHASDSDAWAKFELLRYKHTEYRDLSHMSERDKAAQPITVTLVDESDNVLSTIEVQPNAGVHMVVSFKAHSDGVQKQIVYTVGDDPAQYTISSSAYNAGKELKRSATFYPAQDTTVKLVSGRAYLADAGLMDTRPSGTTPEKDLTFREEVTLRNSNSWHAAFNDLILMEYAQTGSEDNTNVTVYEYYFNEIESNPTGYVSRYVSTITGDEQGTEANRITTSDAIKAINEPEVPLKVEKVWRGVPDATGYPSITFTLYQGIVDNNGNFQAGDNTNWPYPYGSGTEGRYTITLNGKDDDWTWTCPESLPTTIQDPRQGQSGYVNVGYFAKELTTSGYIGDTNKKWELYYYTNSEGKGSDSQHPGGDPSQPWNAGLSSNSGTFTIINGINKTDELDIKKQFFLMREAGSWDNITNHETDQVRNGVVLGFKVIRRIREMNGEKRYLTGWLDYGSEMRVGYNNVGQPVIDSNNIFFVYKLGDASWEFQIHNNNGKIGFTEQVGLPAYGFYVDGNGQSIPVDYEYSIRETEVYKYLGIENEHWENHGEWYGELQVAPYENWSWFSSLTPGRYKDADGNIHDNVEDPFKKVFHGQDTERIANFQATDLSVTKFWEGDTSAKEVYVKIYRHSPEGTEDFTHIIAEDIVKNQNWQSYMEDPSDIDTDHEWLVLRYSGQGQWTNSTLKVNRALLGNLANTGWYTYYIEEVGYMDKNGGFHDDVSQFNPTYLRWVDGQWHETNAGDSGYTLGEKGSNKLAVTNDTNPKTSFTGKKTWTEGYPTDGTQVTLKVQQRYRYERIFYDDPEHSTGAKEYVWTAATGVPDFEGDREAYDNPSNWTLKETVDALPEDQQHWLTEWKDISVTANLPVAKPGTFAGTNVEWLATADAWTYTWENLPATKKVDDATATCYYRAIEVSETPYNLAKVNDQDQTAYTGSRAAENASTGTETIVNTPTKLQLEVEKKWRKDGVEASWPADYTVNYQFYQDYHLVTTDDTASPVTYSMSDVFKSVPLNKTDSWNTEIEGEVSGELTDSTPVATLTKVPGRAVYTATVADVEAADEKGITLVAGTKYLVEFTYHAVETVVNAASGMPAYTVDTTVEYPATRKTQTTTEHNDETDSDEEVTTELSNVNGEPIFKANITNDLKTIVVEKKWSLNGEELADWPAGAVVAFNVYRVAKIKGTDKVVGTETLVYSSNANSTNINAAGVKRQIDNLPVAGVYATGQTLTEAEENLELTANTTYPVTYTYVVKEDAANSTLTGATFSAVVATISTTELGEDPDKVTVDMHTITNDFTNLKITKVWKRNGETITGNGGWPEGDYKVAWKVIRTIVGDTSETPEEVEVANSGKFTVEGTTITLNNEAGNTDRRLTKDNPSVDISYLPTHGNVEGNVVEYAYKVVEVPEYSVKPATSQYTYTAQVATAAAGTGDDAGKMVHTLTNELTDVDVTKTWANNEPYADSITVKLYRTTDIPADQLCQVTVNVSFSTDFDKITDNTITATVAGKTLTLTKDGSNDLWTGTVGLEKVTEATIAFTTPVASDDYTVTLENQTINVDDAATQTVNINGTVTPPVTGRTITLTVNWTGNNSWNSNQWSHVDQYQSSNAAVDVNGNRPEFAEEFSSTNTSQSISGLTNDGYRIVLGEITSPDLGSYDVSVNVGTLSNNWNKQIIIDIPGSDQDQNITLTISPKSNEKPTGTGSITIQNETSNGYWYNPLKSNGVEFNTNSTLNGNSSMTVNNLPAGEFTIQMGVADVNLITGASSVEDWGGNCNIHVVLAEGESKTVVIQNSQSGGGSGADGKITVTGNGVNVDKTFTPGATVTISFRKTNGYNNAKIMNGSTVLWDWARHPQNNSQLPDEGVSVSFDFTLPDSGSVALTTDDSSYSIKGLTVELKDDKNAVGNRKLLGNKKALLGATPQITPVSETVALHHVLPTVEVNYVNAPDVSGMGDPIDTQTLTVDSKNEDGTVYWYYKWSDLPMKDPETGATYHYYVVEEVPNDTQSVTYGRTEGTSGTAVTIHNAPVVPPEYGTFIVTKSTINVAAEVGEQAIETDRLFTVRIKRTNDGGATYQWLHWTNANNYSWGVEDGAKTAQFNIKGRAMFTGLDDGYTYVVVEDTGTGMVEVDGYVFQSADSTVEVSKDVNVATAKEYTGELVNKYKPSTVDFTVKKVWNVLEKVVAWPANVESITLTMVRGTESTDPANAGTIAEPDNSFSLTVTVPKVSGTKTEPGTGTLTIVRTTGDSITNPVDDKLTGITGTVKEVWDENEDKIVNYEIYVKGLEPGYIYRVTEESLEGYVATFQNAEGVTKGLAEKNAYTGEQITNSFVVYELPSTGGVGTTMFYVFGSILTLLALVLLITKKRTDGQGIE